MNELTSPQGSHCIIENVSLANLTTIGIGGPARFYTEVRNTDQLVSAIAWAKKQAIPFFILGGGSNILIADRGFDGLVIKMAICGTETHVEGNQATITVGAGEVWDDFVSHCVHQEYAGIECLSGIPGLVGATPIQNVGAYGQEVSETIESVEALETTSGKTVRIGARECVFGYRTSRFKAREPGRFVITQVTYNLVVGRAAAAVRYPDLEKALVAQGSSSPSLTQVREAVLSIRRMKGMVLDPADPDTRSVGSFFVNPVVTADQLDDIRSRAEQVGYARENVPVFPAEGGNFKLSAAWLIEGAGLRRGYSLGNARISTKHSLAITNRGGAAAREIIALADEIKSKVLDKFGIVLSIEPLPIGFQSDPKGL
jgi:UDP-N-acetylmuramate dehydrogenase